MYLTIRKLPLYQIFSLGASLEALPTPILWCLLPAVGTAPFVQPLTPTQGDPDLG